MISHIIFVFSVHFSKQTSVIYVPDLLIYTNNFLIFNGFFFTCIQLGISAVANPGATALEGELYVF